MFQFCHTLYFGDMVFHVLIFADPIIIKDCSIVYAQHLTHESVMTTGASFTNIWFNFNPSMDK